MSFQEQNKCQVLEPWPLGNIRVKMEAGLQIRSLGPEIWELGPKNKVKNYSWLLGENHSYTCDKVNGM